jgi:hypothetical protein
METLPKPKTSTDYESCQRPRQRGEEYYPSDTLKKWLNDYATQTGVYKSELAVRLLRSFFAARRKEGRDPSVITLLPEIKAAKPRKEKGKKKKKKKKSKPMAQLSPENNTNECFLSHF